MNTHTHTHTQISYKHRNGTIDLLMADSPILDYYRATDHGCSLQRIGETFVEDTYAIGMVKGFPLKESISALIAKYSTNGYLDILTEKWYGGLPCFKYEAEIVTPRPLGKWMLQYYFLVKRFGKQFSLSLYVCFLFFTLVWVLRFLLLLLYCYRICFLGPYKSCQWSI